jgi:hypothetical protein
MPISIVWMNGSLPASEDTQQSIFESSGLWRLCSFASDTVLGQSSGYILQRLERDSLDPAVENGILRRPAFGANSANQK